MTTQPKALRLADKLNYQVYFGAYDWKRVKPMMAKSADELRQLYKEVELQKIAIAALVAAAERETCATLAERVGSCDANMAKAWRSGCTDVAAAIRARSKA